MNGSRSVERDEKHENSEQNLNSNATGSEGATGDGDTSGVVKVCTDTGQQQKPQRQPCGEHPCVYTDLPKFLITYSPKVHVWSNMYNCSFMLSSALVLCVAFSH